MHGLTRPGKVPEDVGTMMTPIFQMRKLRHSNVAQITLPINGEIGIQFQALSFQNVLLYKKKYSTLRNIS